jgi:hypothetical protein
VLSFNSEICGVKYGLSSRILRRKYSQHAFLRGEVKPSVPCRRFAACNRSLNLRGSRNLGKITGLFLAQISTFCCYDLSRRCGRTGNWRGKLERLKAGESNGKLLAKNLSRMQCARAIPFTRLSSASCQSASKAVN